MLSSVHPNYRDLQNNIVVRQTVANSLPRNPATEFDAWKDSTYKLVTGGDWLGLGSRFGTSLVMQVATRHALMPFVQMGVTATLGSAGLLPLLATSIGVALLTTVGLTGMQNAWAALHGEETHLIADLETGLLFSIPSTIFGVGLTQKFAPQAGALARAFFDLGTELPQGIVSGVIREGTDEVDFDWRKTESWKHLGQNMVMETVDGGINNVLGMGAEGVRNIPQLASSLTLRLMNTTPILTRSALLFPASTGVALAASSVTNDGSHFLMHGALAGAVLIARGEWSNRSIRDKVEKIKSNPNDPTFDQVLRMVKAVYDTSRSHFITKILAELEQIRAPKISPETDGQILKKIKRLKNKLNGDEILNEILDLPKEKLSAERKKLFVEVFDSYYHLFRNPKKFLKQYLSGCNSPSKNGFHFELEVLKALEKHPHLEVVACSQLIKRQEIDLILRLKNSKLLIYVEIKTTVTGRTFTKFQNQINNLSRVAHEEQAPLIVIVAPAPLNPSNPNPHIMVEQAETFLKQKRVPYFTLPDFLSLTREQLEEPIGSGHNI